MGSRARGVTNLTSNRAGIGESIHGMTHQTDDTEVVRGSDTSLRDKVEQMYRQAASVKQPDGTCAPHNEEFDRWWAQYFQPYQPS